MHVEPGLEAAVAAQAMIELGLTNVIVHEVAANDVVGLTQIEVPGVAQGDFDMHVTIDRHLGNATWLLRECVPSAPRAADCRHVVIDSLGEHEVEMFAVGREKGHAWVAYAGDFAIADSQVLVEESLDLLAELASLVRDYGVPNAWCPNGVVAEYFSKAVRASDCLRAEPRLSPHPLCQGPALAERVSDLPPVA